MSFLALHIEFNAAGEAVVIGRAIHEAYRKALAVMVENGAPVQMQKDARRRMAAMEEFLSRAGFDMEAECLDAVPPGHA